MLKKILHSLFGSAPDQEQRRPRSVSPNPISKGSKPLGTPFRFSSSDTNCTKDNSDSRASYLARCCFAAIMEKDRKSLTNLLFHELPKCSYLELNHIDQEFR